uniref:Ig-like domain-containing protein n=1 Tax=Mola mola TaxID=94237 RepID=A0A3Q3WQH2_MOLML
RQKCKFRVLVLLLREKKSPISNLDMVFTGESVTFTCTIDVSSGWDFLWYHNGNDIQSTGSTYTINSINDHDRGEYHCQARRGKYPFYTEASNVKNLQVFALPKPSLKLLTPWTDVFENETLTFSCEVDDSDWMFSWYRNQDLNIARGTLLDGGTYECMGKRRKTMHETVRSDKRILHVSGKPKLLCSPSNSVMHTGDSVSFSCHINVSSGWEFLWYKDGTQLVESGNNHTILSVLTRNTGSYSCQTRRGRNVVFLSPQSQAVKLDVKVGVSPFGLCVYRAHIVKTQDDPEQSLYTCQGIRAGSPSYSEISDQFKTKNLREYNWALNVAGFSV